jgi:heme O synthase-like polyprenyltransferase
MWFYPVVLVLVILAIVGATLAGGIFTIVLVPLAAIALVSAVVSLLWGRALEGSADTNIDASHTTARPLPHQRRRPSGRSRTSPERLADTRRRQQ